MKLVDFYEKNADRLELVRKEMIVYDLPYPQMKMLDIDKPYMFHAINVKWHLDTFWVCIDSSNRVEFTRLINLFDEILINDDEAGSWQFSSEIYVPEE